MSTYTRPKPQEVKEQQFQRSRNSAGYQAFLKLREEMKQANGSRRRQQ